MHVHIPGVQIHARLHVDVAVHKPLAKVHLDLGKKEVKWQSESIGVHAQNTWAPLLFPFRKKNLIIFSGSERNKADSN